MERIKQALERARAERESHQLHPRMQRSATGKRRPAGQVAEHTGPIDYTQTKKVDITQDHLNNQRIIAHQEEDEFADAYKMLRTQVLQRLVDHDWNVLAVTSPGKKDGKTTTAVNLASSLSLEVGYTVLLVDANLRHPGVHTQFGLSASEGLSDYLLDNAPLSDLLLHPKGIDDLTILPAGKVIRNSSEMLNSPRMGTLVQELKSRYPQRIIIFDLPPVLEGADALAFTPQVDATLLVTADNETKKADIERSLELLSSTNVIGTILNKVNS